MAAIASIGIAIFASGAEAAPLASTTASTMIVARNDGILQIVGHADPIVKFVMILLLLASIATWSIWIVKRRELRQAKRALHKDIKILANARTLKEADQSSYPATHAMVCMAVEELKRAGDRPSPRALEGVEERVAVQLPIAESRAIHRVLWGTNVLASIGAISPFVGLAGTVWGIMNSFLGISRSHSTSLAVVAPGIAEALMATAIGLAAAIPAVLIYNSLARSIAGYRRLLSEVSVLIACVVSRQAELIAIGEPADSAAVAPRRPAGARADTVIAMPQAPAETIGR